MQERAEGLLKDIYEAALFPDLWEKVVYAIKGVCPGANVEIMLYDQITSNVPWFVNTLEHSTQKQYCEHYKGINSLWPVMKKLECGCVSDTDYFDVVNQVKKTEFYNDYMLPNDWVYIQGMNIATIPSTIGACVLELR